MKKSIIFTLSIVSIICFSCERHCPGFPVNETSLIPYYQGQNISFTSGDETMHLTIDSVYYSKPQSYSWNCKYSCEKYAYMYTAINSEYNIAFEQSIHFSDTTFDLRIVSYEYTLMGNKMTYHQVGSDIFNFTKNDTTDKNNIYPYLYNINWDQYINFEVNRHSSINDVEYKDVFMWEVDTNTFYDARIWKLYFAENVGVVKFHERNPVREWELIAE